MPRPLSTTNAAGVLLPVTEPIWLLDMGFATPIRLSSRETLSYESNTYTGVEMEVTINPASASIKFWKDSNLVSGLWPAGF